MALIASFLSAKFAAAQDRLAALSNQSSPGGACTFQPSRSDAGREFAIHLQRGPDEQVYGVAIEMPTETVFAAPKTELINGKPAEAKLGNPVVSDSTAAWRESSLKRLVWRK
jgi:hypothetical protein